ncbi:MAG: hypothetical protein ACJAVK_000084 [Akkermansiaceae bacterium]|jgi:hypothetical protein
MRWGKYPTGSKQVELIIALKCLTFLNKSGDRHVGSEKSRAKSKKTLSQVEFRLFLPPHGKKMLD